MTTKTQLRNMQSQIRELMTELNEIGDGGLDASDEANINTLYEDMRAIHIKLGETARTFKSNA